MGEQTWQDIHVRDAGAVWIQAKDGIIREKASCTMSAGRNWRQRQRTGASSG